MVLLFILVFLGICYILLLVGFLFFKFCIIYVINNNYILILFLMNIILKINIDYFVYLFKIIKKMIFGDNE